jgi:microcompartment protein CcmK/EutM
VKLCRVLGAVVSTAKHPSYAGRTLLVVQPLDEAQAPAGASYLAVDTVQAGEGDLVLVLTEGNGARQIFKREGVAGDHLPIRSTVVGVVDDVELARS